MECRQRGEAEGTGERDVKTTIRDSLMVVLYRMVQINNNEPVCWLMLGCFKFESIGMR